LTKAYIDLKFPNVDRYQDSENPSVTSRDNDRKSTPFAFAVSAILKQMALAFAPASLTEKSQFFFLCV
jgi:hypothetical protein